MYKSSVGSEIAHKMFDDYTVTWTCSTVQKLKIQRKCSRIWNQWIFSIFAWNIMQILDFRIWWYFAYAMVLLMQYLCGAICVLVDYNADAQLDRVTHCMLKDSI